VCAQVNCLNAVLSATRFSRLSIGILATLQSDWMSCVQCDSGLFSWSRTLSREWSVGARRRACPTHRRRFWLNSANSGGTSVSRRTRSRITCSSGVLAKGRRLQRVPQFGPQNPAYGGAKISGDPIQSVCLQGILVVSLLASILRSWHRGCN